MAAEAVDVAAVGTLVEDVAAEVAVTEEEEAVARVTHSRKVNAPEAVDADSLTRAEEEAEVRTPWSNAERLHNAKSLNIVM